MFREFFMMLMVMLFGFDSNPRPKNDLRRKPTRNDYRVKTNNVIQRNMPIIAFTIIFLCFIVFIAVCFAVVGASGTESGNVYNHFQDVI